MPQISYISIKDIKEARRYDAEYFKPEYLRDDFSLEKKGYNFLIDISSVKGGKRLPLGENFSDDGVPYIRAEDVKNNFVQYENVPKISEELHKKLINYQTKKNDVLLTIVGNSVGDIGIVKFDLKKCNLTENASKITNLKEINSESLFVYMLSKFGQNQIHREKVGTAQPKLALERIRKFKIPILPQSFQLQIEQIVKTAHQKQALSKQLYKEAEELLLIELGLVNYQVKHKLWFSITKKEIGIAKRFDSEYFQPKYEEIIERIEKYEGGWDFADEMVKWKKGIEVGTEAYTETGKDFVRVSDFSIYGISETNRKISDQAFEELKNNFQPKQGDILFTKDGTIGISYVLKENIQGVLSGAFLRLTLKEKYKNFEKECLSLIFNSILCKMQVEKLSGGALIAHLKPSDFETFKIPLIKPQVQKQIAEKIQESHKLRKESKELLEEAKRKVEEEIEKAPSAP
jgi:restriction endonuclease S subunit